jgi:photosystem II stability/assembly factor-like uncharacterized protein
MKKFLPALLSLLAFDLTGTRISAADTGPLTSETFMGLELRNLCPAVTPARVQDIAVDPHNRSVWYIASAASGLWKTSNRGINWKPVFDEYGSYSLGCVVVDPKNSDVVWLGTGENQSLRSVSYGDGIYKSTDAGATWKRMGLPHSEHLAKILIDPRNSDVVYVASQGPLWAPGGDRGLFKTTDGGETWKAVLTISENTGVTDASFDPRNPDVIYAAAYQRRRNVGLLIGGGPEAGLFKSTDAGATWTKLTNGIPDEDKGRICLAVSPQQPDVVYAVITLANRKGGFFKSEDAGATWTRQRDYNMVDPQYYGEMYCDPHKFDRVYIIDSTTSYTDNGGKTIQQVRWNVHVDHHALEFDPTDADHLLTGNDGGLYESFDGGKTWRYFDNIPMQQFYGVATDNALPFYHVYGGAQDNGSLGAPSRTTSRLGIPNSAWEIVGGGDGMQPRVDPKNPDILYTQSQNASISRWDLDTSVSTGIQPRRDSNAPVRWNWDTPLIVSPHAANRIYLAGSRLFRSDDRGGDWKMISPDLTRQIDRDTLPVMGKMWGPNAVAKNLFTTELGVSTALCESPRKEGLLYIGTDDGLVQVSDNGGEKWTKIESFPGVPSMALVSHVAASAHDTDTVYASFNNYQNGDFHPYVLKSVNRGKDWTSITGNLPENYPVWTIVEDPVNKNLLFAGTEFGLFVSIDGGARWTQLKGGGVPTAAFRDLEIQQRESDLVCATFGRGFYILDDISGLRALKPETLAKDAVLLPLRPAKLFHELTYTHASAGNITMPNPPFGAVFTYYMGADAAKDSPTIVLQVTDASGKNLPVLSGTATPGIHRAVWNLTAPAPAGARGGRAQPDIGNKDGDDDEEEEAARMAAAAEQEPESAAELQQAAGGGATNAGGGGDAPAGAGGRGGGRGGGGRGGRGGGGGVLVSPGKFKVTLGKMVEGKLVPLAEPQTFEVVPLDYGAPRSGAK